LIRDERMRRGRAAPESNQNAAEPSALRRYVQGVFLGCVVGLTIGYVLGIVVPKDICQIRASSSHVSVCLDGPISKVKGLVR
jgi:hypothetical protein